MGDESRVCSQGYVPYGWQFTGEDIHIPVKKAYKINRSGFINRQSRYMEIMTESSIISSMAIEYPEELSLWRGCLSGNSGGLFIPFLPPYSPHLNIAETVWRKIKKWLNPEDHMEKDRLYYAVNRYMKALGKQNCIKFSHLN